MRIARILWLGAAVAIGSLLIPLQTRQERRDRDTTTERFDEPGEAARSDLARRQPTDGRLDLPRSYDAAARHVASLARFSSAIGRGIPAAQPASRVWLSGSRVMSLRDTSSAAGALDAWTPLGPGNIGGSYNVTITASSTCSANLPADTRVLNYVSDISQTGAAFNAQLLAHVIFNTVTVTGTVSGQTLNFSTFSVNEITESDGVVLATTGTASVAANGSINGTLSGTYQTTSGTNCNTGSHQIQMVKR